jgi:hypothetical protein
MGSRYSPVKVIVRWIESEIVLCRKTRAKPLSDHPLAALLVLQRMVGEHRFKRDAATREREASAARDIEAKVDAITAELVRLLEEGPES